MKASERWQARIPEADVRLGQPKLTTSIECGEPTPWRRSLATLAHRRIIRESESLRASFTNAASWRSRNRGRCSANWRWTASLYFQHDRDLADQIRVELDRHEYPAEVVEQAFLVLRNVRRRAAA